MKKAYQYVMVQRKIYKMKNKKSWKFGRKEFIKNLEKKLEANYIISNFNQMLEFNSEELQFMSINDIKNKKIIYELTEGEKLFLELLDCHYTLNMIFNYLHRRGIYE